MLATPLLTALADNGGPTRSMVLLTGSPALSAAVAPCAATDQRSTTRPQGNGCDSGAFESALLAALGIKRVGRRRF
ncbi:MAG: hypothetical protein IPN53_13245 [Comamonadaceae bacterium]|nr:hypothetical protein [Comamonadaceae bacterium]